MTDPAYDPTDRRPIQSRNTRWAETATSLFVKRDISPNAISLFGMLAAMTAGAAFFSTSFTAGPIQRALWFFGGALCQVRLLCNLFDGMVAMERNIASPKGELYNEVPDRISDSAVFIGLGYAVGGSIPLGWFAALISVFIAYIRAMSKSLGAPSDYCGPMAKPQRMALATALALYLAFSSSAWRFSWGEAKMVLVVVILGGIVTAIRRLTRTAKHLEGTP